MVISVKVLQQVILVISVKVLQQVILVISNKGPTAGNIGHIC